MTATTVVNRKTSAYEIYIGRPSKWGNPYLLGQKHPRTGQRMSRTQVIEAYEQYLDSRPDLLRDLPELQGHVLGCWCAPLPCHGHVLARRADALASAGQTISGPTRRGDDASVG